MLYSVLLSLALMAMPVNLTANKTSFVAGEQLAAKASIAVPTGVRPVINIRFWVVSSAGDYVNLSASKVVVSGTTYSASGVYTWKSTDRIANWTLKSAYQQSNGAWSTAAETLPLVLSKTAAPPPSSCTYTYSEWSACQSNSLQSRTVTSATPSGCVGTPVISQSCTYIPLPPPPVEPPAPSGGNWLHTAGNHIYTADNAVWMGRGANVFDTRGCNACAYSAPNVAEVKRRIDELVNWGATFLRLDLESYAAAEGRTSWASPSKDPAYLASIVEIVNHATAKVGVYVEVSLWIDPSIASNGWPTEATAAEWRVLSRALMGNSKVMFGVVNEPQNNFSGASDAGCWLAMKLVVDAIRAVEVELGSPQHLIAVQGTRAWARDVSYYATRPMGANIVYEAHIYDPTAEANRLLLPAATIPMIIGEFGPAPGYMTLAETQALMLRADELQVPYLGWALHQRCPPNLLVDTVGYGCGAGMPLTPTPWGQQLRAHLELF
jgi:hypothetical protein